MIFALSGAIGPIVGQNFGAREFDRVKESLTRAIQFCCAYVLAVSVLLFFSRNLIVDVFDMKGDAADLILFFCRYIAVFFVFSGILFVANASFNNLGKAKYSSLFNVGKATVGTVPFVYFGAQWGGAYGVLIGQVLGSMIFGVLGVIVAYRLVEHARQAVTEHTSALSADTTSDKKAQSDEFNEELSLSNQSPLSSSCANMAMVTEEQDCEASSEVAELIGVKNQQPPNP